ncbi:hypothetical protein [Actinokineospora globicatena]|uniref:hypothetical protein n=1 Tax=Actinokineospora globicatena TaxID=103729 RepID=UPI0020A452AE|nr:hypothetical protein [Actinokineospora globicatena]
MGVADRLASFRVGWSRGGVEGDGMRFVGFGRVGAVVAAVLVMAGVLAPAAGATQTDTCWSGGNGLVVGGYVAYLSCNGGSLTFSGVGTTLADAESEVQATRAMYLAGQYCTSSTSSATVGGYSVRLACNSGSAVFTGVGTTLTDASREVRAVQAIQATGQHCSSSTSSAVVGGYSVSLACDGGSAVFTGVGTTLTEASGEVRAVRAMYAAGKYCTSSTSSAVSGGYEVSLACNGGSLHYRGRGATVTLASRAARAAVV